MANRWFATIEGRPVCQRQQPVRPKLAQDRHFAQNENSYQTETHVWRAEKTRKNNKKQKRKPKKPNICMKDTTTLV
jgi:hypothetical protein